MVHIRLVNVYLMNVPSVSSPYFKKIKRMSHLGKWHALSLEILNLLESASLKHMQIFQTILLLIVSQQNRVLCFKFLYVITIMGG